MPSMETTPHALEASYCAPCQVPCASLAQTFPRLRGDLPPMGTRSPSGAALPPPARGSPSPASLWEPNDNPSPACAGISPSRSTWTPTPAAFPRLRGDLSGPHSGRMLILRLPPPARGSPCTRSGVFDRALPSPACAGISLHSHLVRWNHGPSPACAGISPPFSRTSLTSFSFPRLRGDLPVTLQASMQARLLPPPARGSPSGRTCEVFILRPSPACAGISPRRASHRTWLLAFPRLRGALPLRAVTSCHKHLPSPPCAGSFPRVISSGSRGDLSSLPISSR